MTTGFTQKIEYAAGADPDRGFRSLWTQWQQIAPVAVVRDIPLPDVANIDRCLNPSSAQVQADCVVPRSQALPQDPILTAASKAQDPRFQFVDLSDLYCGAAQCYPVVGGVPVYYDRNHLNSAFRRRSPAVGLGAALAYRRTLSPQPGLMAVG